VAFVDFVHRGLDHFYRAIANQIRDVLPDGAEVNLLQWLFWADCAPFELLPALLALVLLIHPLNCDSMDGKK
jgi:hypothetical protein